MKRALALGLVLIATAVSATELAKSNARETLGQKTQWAPSGNFSALHGRAAFQGEIRGETRPYARARGQLASGIGIFLSRDSIGAQSYLGSPNGMGPWSYANLSPARYTDPDGRRPQTPQEAAEISKLRALAKLKETAAGLGDRIEAFLAKGNPLAPPRDSRALLKYADRWADAIEHADDEVPVLIRESVRPDIAEKFAAGMSIDSHLHMTDATGNDFLLDTGASFETAPEYDAKSRDLAFIEALQIGPDNPFRHLAESLGGNLPGGAGGKRMSARRPGLPKNLLKSSRASLRGTLKGTPSELARWNARESRFDLNVNQLRAESGRFAKDLERVTAPSSDVHGNSLAATGPHDVYVIRSSQSQAVRGGGQVSRDQVLHFGETGRGWEVRGSEWVQQLREEYGIDARVEPLQSVDGKAAARALETRYISTYEKLFGVKPGYVDATGTWVPIQKSLH